MDRNLLYRFFQGVCTKDEIRQVRNWMEPSSDNKERFLKESKLFDTLNLLAPQISARPKKNTTLQLYLRICLEVAVIILVFLFGYSIYNQQIIFSEQMTTINVPIGKNVNVILPDGSSVWLNARSKLQYSTDFNKKERNVILDGEGYFDVTSNKDKPFIVKTKNYKLEVLGTSFNVEAYSSNSKFAAALIHGAIKIASIHNTADSIHLKPNTLAINESGKLVVKKIDDYNSFRWKEGLICFNHKSFAEVMCTFEKHFDVIIRVENQDVYKYFCTGKFRQIDGVDYALRVLSNNIKFSFERDNGSNIIHIK